MIVIPQEKILEVMQGVIDDFLKPKFISLGMNASGDWLNSLEARASLNRGEIWGLDYTYYLVNGRAGGKRPPIAPLVRWVGYKLGKTGNEGIGIAYAVANKIAKEGTSYYPEGTDLLDILNSQDVVNYINSKLKEFYLHEVRLEILRMTKKTLGA